MTAVKVFLGIFQLLPRLRSRSACRGRSLRCRRNTATQLQFRTLSSSGVAAPAERGAEGGEARDLLGRGNPTGSLRGPGGPGADGGRAPSRPPDPPPSGAEQWDAALRVAGRCPFLLGGCIAVRSFTADCESKQEIKEQENGTAVPIVSSSTPG